MSYALKIKAIYRGDGAGRELRLPAITTEAGIVISHLRYLSVNSNKSASWKDLSVYALILLIHFISANSGRFSRTVDLLRAFCTSLEEGTIHPSSFSDPSGLFWLPRSPKNSKKILYMITHYTDWLSAQSGFVIKPVNSFRKASSVEERLNWCAIHQRRNKVFLNHLRDTEQDDISAKLVRVVRSHEVPVEDVTPAVQFPEEKIYSLLSEGFIRLLPKSGVAAPDFKGRAITLLMHYGGLRKCEVLHIYLSDIILDEVNNEAVVRVYHPRHGKAPGDSKESRREFLMAQYGLMPRTQYLKTERLHLGWKNPLLSHKDGYFQVNFFPSSKAHEFLENWVNYLKFQRAEPDPRYDHPYAFTNSFGRPETLKNA